MEREEKDDLKDLLDAMDTALVLDPGKPTNMETEVELNPSEDEEDVSAVRQDSF